MRSLYHKNTTTAIPLYQNCGFLAEKERFLRSPMQLQAVLRTSSVAVCSAGLPKQSPGLFGLRPSNLFKSQTKNHPIGWFLFGGEGEIPSQPYATPSGAPRLFRCGLLRCGGQNVSPTRFASPFESLPIKTKNHPIGWLSFWRRRRDSNSRTVLSVTRFPVVRPRPAKRLLRIINFALNCA